MEQLDQFQSRSPGAPAISVSSRNETNGGSASAAGKLLCAVLLFGVLCAVAFWLFYGITSVGMVGFDTFDYWNYANDILHGRHNFNSDRLSFYALNALALKVLGPNDYAIRAFIGGLAVLNIALLYLLAYRLSRNALVALVAAALYAINPTILKYSAAELPHIPGATFVLLACLFTLVATDWTKTRRVRLIGAFCAGIALAGAVLTHEDLIFLCVGFVVAISLLTLMHRAESFELGKRNRLTVVASNKGMGKICYSHSDAGQFGMRELLAAYFALALGGIVGAAWPMFATDVGPGKMIDDFLTMRAILDQNTAVNTGGAFFKTEPLRLLRNGTVDTLGWSLAALAGVLAVIIPIEYIRRRSDRLASLLTIEIPVLVYIVSFVGIGRIYLLGGYQRLFVPLIGPLIAFAVCGFPLVFGRVLFRRLATVAVVGVALCAAWAYQPWKYQMPYTSGPWPHRELYDATKNLVGPDRKLLLPACYPNWVGIDSPVYLGENVVSIYPMAEFTTFDATISANKIGYVLVPRIPLRGWSVDPAQSWTIERMQKLFSTTYGMALGDDQLKTAAPVSQKLWKSDTRADWSREVCAFESQLVRGLLEARGARLAVTTPWVGDIFELRH